MLWFPFIYIFNTPCNLIYSMVQLGGPKQLKIWSCFGSFDPNALSSLSLTFEPFAQIWVISCGAATYQLTNLLKGHVCAKHHWVTLINTSTQNNTPLNNSIPLWILNAHRTMHIYTVKTLPNIIIYQWESWKY